MTRRMIMTYLSTNRRCGMKIRTDNTPNRIPSVRITLPGIYGERLAMIDTGSAITLYDEGIADAVLHETSMNCEMDVTGICGSQNSSGEWITSVVTMHDTEGNPVHLKMEGATYDMGGVIDYYRTNYGLDPDFAMIIGSDVLSSLGARIDYENNMLMIDEKEDRQFPEVRG